ncbi:MAG: Ldh family oxidoreductase [Spirochaetia bacterium]
MSDDEVRLSLEEVAHLAERVCRAAGYSPSHAGAISRTVTAAERDEARSHGLFRIPFYVNALEEGGVSPDTEPEVSQPAPGVVRVDARWAFAPRALEVGLPYVAEAARESGIAALSVVNAFNVAALWPEVERLAEDGLVAMAFTASLSYVAPAGGSEPLYGTNPMAFAWPREGKPPLVFDQASSAAARGEIQLRKRDGESIPEGWAIDSAGEPTTDPAAALEGAQLPFGGHKGSSIALMIELLAGALLGDLFSFEASEADAAGTGAPRGGELIIAMDPQRFIPGPTETTPATKSTAGDTSENDGASGASAASQFEHSPLAHAERLFSRVLAQEGARLPGDRRYAARRRTRAEGVSVPRSFYEELLALTH